MRRRVSLGNLRAIEDPAASQQKHLKHLKQSGAVKDPADSAPARCSPYPNWPGLSIRIGVGMGLSRVVPRRVLGMWVKLSSHHQSVSTVPLLLCLTRRVQRL